MKIVIAPIHKTTILGKYWKGLNLGKIKTDIESHSNHTVEIVDFSEIANDTQKLPEKAVLFYTASYNANYNQYIKDVVLNIALARPDVILIPSLDQLFSFENKGYQELYKKRLGIEKVAGKYYGDVEEYWDDAQRIDFPFVYKLPQGALSRGVSLIKGKEELSKLDQENKKKTLKQKFVFHRMLQKIIKNKNNYYGDVSPTELNNFKNTYTKRTPFVVQDFVPNLDCDFKVLVFGEKYYVFRRKVRKDDFRASGSGMFEWVRPDDAIFDFAREVHFKMKNAFISLDLAIDADKNVYLLEFQGIGFGPIGLLRSQSYFEKQHDSWVEITAKSDLDEAYAASIVAFLKNR